ncbi:MAG: hypothetical protein M3250_02285 [Thermoproteota archaeon]|nr:hypothetical protein [Thermoproteota archaeon]
MQGNASFNNHPTLTVDSASSLSAKVPVFLFLVARSKKFVLKILKDKDRFA